MRKLILLCLLTLPSLAYSQYSGTGLPALACGVGNVGSSYQDSSTGSVYTCKYLPTQSGYFWQGKALCYVSSGTLTCPGGGGGGGGNLSGTLTTGKIPIATAAHTLADSTLDYGVTTPGGWTQTNSGAGGTVITDSGGGGLTLFDSATSGPGLEVKGSAGIQLITANDQDPSVTDGPISITSGGSLFLDTDPTTSRAVGINISNTGTVGTVIQDNGGGGISIEDLTSVTVPIKIGPLTQPLLLYSAAGTALPAAASVPAGTEATVSDATLPTYMGAYVSGGAVVCKVISDGATNWFTH